MQKTLIIWAISAFSIWSCTEKSADIPTTPATSKDTTQVDTSQLEAPDVVLQSRNKPVFLTIQARDAQAVVVGVLLLSKI